MYEIIKNLDRISDIDRTYITPPRGLCGLLYHLRAKEIIDYYEFHATKYYMDNLLEGLTTYSYWWEPDLVEPRKEWLLEQIESLKTV
jgi:hypothetical protein